MYQKLKLQARVKVHISERPENEAKSFQEILASRRDFTERRHFESEKPRNIQNWQQSTELLTTCKPRFAETSVVCRCSVGDMSAV